MSKQKECPSCAMMIDSKEDVCPICGYEFAQTQKSKLTIVIIALFLLLLALFVFVF